MKKLSVLLLCIVISTSCSLRLKAQDWAQVGAGVNGEIRCMAIYNGDLYVAGSFTHAGGIVVNNIAKWDGSAYTTVGTGTVGVYSMCVYNGELYAYETNYTNGWVVKWNGTSWSTFLPPCTYSNPLTCGLSESVAGSGGQQLLVVYNNKLCIASSGSKNIFTWDGTTLDTL